MGHLGKLVKHHLLWKERFLVSLGEVDLCWMPLDSSTYRLIDVHLLSFVEINFVSFVDHV